MDVAIIPEEDQQQSGGAAWMLDYLHQFDIDAFSSRSRGPLITMFFRMPRDLMANINFEKLKSYTESIQVDWRSGEEVYYGHRLFGFGLQRDVRLTIKFNEATSAYFINILKKQKRLQ